MLMMFRPLVSLCKRPTLRKNTVTMVLASIVSISLLSMSSPVRRKDTRYVSSSARKKVSKVFHDRPKRTLKMS